MENLLNEQIEIRDKIKIACFFLFWFEKNCFGNYNNNIFSTTKHNLPHNGFD